MSKQHHVGVEKLTQEQMDENVFESAKRMMSSATFGQVIILIVYLPIMALVGIEGKMFRPMAQVVVFALDRCGYSFTYLCSNGFCPVSEQKNRTQTHDFRSVDGSAAQSF